MSIEGRSLTFGYDKRHPLFSRVDIGLGAGEIVGLHGYSGSGKTTLGKVLAGYYEPFQGQVMVDDKPLENAGFRCVQMIHQHPEKSINPRWRVKRALHNIKDDLEELMDHFELEQRWLSRYPRELSGGELQRFCIARAFDRRTKYLIADEITTMLDGILQAKIWKQIIDLANERNMGILVVSHDSHLLDKLCSRTIDFQKLV